MKKISLALIAAILTISFCGVTSVFAALTEGENYTIKSYTGTEEFGTQTIAATATGLSYVKNIINTPQKSSEDASYHISGTSKITNADRFSYTLKPDFDTTTALAVNRYNYTVSFDIYPKKNMAFCVRGGFGSNPNQRNDAFFNTLDETNPIAINRWSHITINMQADNTNDSHKFIMDIYVNGKRTDGVTKYDAQYTGDISLTFANFSLDLVKDQEYDFYIDNFVTAASDDKFAETVPYVSSVNETAGTLNGDVIELIQRGITAMQLKSAITVGTTDEVSICRGNLILSDTAEVKHGDLVCVKGANGLYAYYYIKFTFELGNPVISGTVAPGQVISASVSASGEAPQDITMVFVLFRGITHVETQTATLSMGSVAEDMTAQITVPEKPGNYTAKVFLWDSLSGMNRIDGR